MAQAPLRHPAPAGPARLTGGLALAVGLGLAGCFVVVDPREVVDSPAVSGVLREAGAPVAGALLWVSPVRDPGPCEDLRLSTRTDADGAFAFAETREHRTLEFVPLAPSTPAYTVQVCLDAGAQPRPLYRATFPGALPRHVGLECDLARESDGSPTCTALLTGRQVPGYRGILD